MSTLRRTITVTIDEEHMNAPHWMTTHPSNIDWDEAKRDGVTWDSVAGPLACPPSWGDQIDRGRFAKATFGDNPPEIVDPGEPIPPEIVAKPLTVAQAWIVYHATPCAVCNEPKGNGVHTVTFSRDGMWCSHNGKGWGKL